MRGLAWMLAGIAVGCLLGLLLPTGRGSGKESACDTVVVVDTVRYPMPVAKDSVVVSYKLVKVKICERDTLAQSEDFGYLCGADSAVVELPIEQKVYRDTAYTAWVSGFQPRLDSIEVYPRSSVVAVRAKPPRWSVGVQGGVGITPKGVQPYIGVGVSYRIDL